MNITKALQIGFISAMLAITCSTLAHYAEFWITSYGAALAGGIAIAAIWGEQ